MIGTARQRKWLAALALGALVGLLAVTAPLLAQTEPPARTEVLARIAEAERQTESLAASGHYAEALYHAQQALDWHARLAPPLDRNRAAALNAKAAFLHYQLNHFRPAAQLYQAALTEALAAPPQMLWLIREIAFALASIHLEMEKGADPETLDLARRALDIDLARPAPPLENLLDDYQLLRNIAVVRGDKEQAVDYQRLLAELVALAYGAHSLEHASQLHELASLYLFAGQYPQAEDALEQALAIVRADPGAPARLRDDLQRTLIHVYILQGRWEEALPPLERLEAAIVARLAEIPLTERHQLADLYRIKGDIYFDQRDYAAAQASFQASLVEAILSGSMNDLGIPLNLHKLAEVAGAAGEEEKAARLYVQAARMIMEVDPQELSSRQDRLVATDIARAGMAALKDGGNQALRDNLKIFLDRMDEPTAENSPGENQ